MRKAICLAAVFVAAVACVDAWSAEPVSHKYYFSTTLGQFLDRCPKDTDWCKSVVRVRVDSEEDRFCFPDDRDSVVTKALAWLRAHQNDVMKGRSESFSKEYLARAVRSAFGNIWGEKGKACPFPESKGGGDDGGGDDGADFLLY